MIRATALLRRRPDRLEYSRGTLVPTCAAQSGEQTCRLDQTELPISQHRQKSNRMHELAYTTVNGQ